MPLSLYDATIPSFVQILRAVRGLIDKAEAFCEAQDRPAEDIIQARLAEDMLPFAYQAKSAVVHSLGAIEGVRRGIFSPDTSTPPDSFVALGQGVDEAIAALLALDPGEIEGFIGRDMRFEFGQFRLDFTAEDFLLSFAQPNFYFHATTLYDILRWRGVEVGKRDFLGALRLRA